MSATMPAFVKELFMSRWSRTAGLLFLAAASVYVDGALSTNTAIAANPQSPSSMGAGGTDVKLLEEPTDPFANPATNPTTQPAEPVQQGQSVNSNDVQVTDDGTVEIHVNDANLVEVLRMLSLQSQKNIIASKDVNGKVTANLYGVTVKEALEAILQSNGFTFREKGNFIYVYTQKEAAEMEKAERVMTTQLFRVHYTPAANAVNMIKPVLSEGAQVSFTTPALSGIESGAKDVGGDSHSTEDVIVVTDYAENLEKVGKVLKEVDRRPQQILIEATILRASLSDNNALGIDFQVLGGVDFTSLTSAGSSFPAAVTGLILNQDGAQNIVQNGYGAAGTGFARQVPQGGLRMGIVSDNIAVFLSALENVTDTTVLANPKVLALNKQKGEVIVGRKDGYLTTTVTESSSTQTVEFLDTGTRLIFRPFIGDDGYIRMEIHPEDSAGGLNSANLPFKITTEVTSNVMIKDGHTIVIGGLFREASVTSKGQVPFLGNIPVAGLLFKQQQDQSTREEIIILLTPHIVKDEVNYSRLSELELREADKLRVGIRKGMMPWGRERLAEAEYEKAVQVMSSSNPDRSKAIWHLNSATNLNPLFLEAINMKEQLTGKSVTDVDNSSIRAFVTDMVMAEKDAAPTTMPSSVEIIATPKQVVKAPEPASKQPEVAVAPSTQPSAPKLATGVVPFWKPWLNTAYGYFTFNSKPREEDAPGTTVTELPTDEMPSSPDMPSK